MKRHFTKVSMFAVAMLMALTANFTLTSCSEDENVQKNTEEPKKQTVFSMEVDGTRSVTIVNEDGTPADEATRTSMDADRWFYWEKGDKIWVKDGGTYHKSIGSNIADAGMADEAKFVVDASLGGQEYPVLYTGYAAKNDTVGTLSGTVTIAAGQSQSAWNKTSHLGYSGDCGVATARKRESGTYKFSLKHKAHYLILKPYMSNGLSGGFKIKKIEIIADGTTLAGTYNFDENGLNTTSGIRTPSNMVTLTCENEFDMAYSATNYCIAVIQPGTHKLTIKYYIHTHHDASSTYGDMFGESDILFTKEISERNYAPGYAIVVKHEMSDPIIEYPNKYYQWDALDENTTYLFGVAQYNNVTPPMTPGDLATHCATRVCASQPNINEWYWYIMHGDARWDSTVHWKIEGTPTVYSGGVWILRSGWINGFSNLAIPGGNDLRLQNAGYQLSGAALTHYKTAGRPNNTIGYFFLPAMGYHSNSTGNFIDPGINGSYWSSTLLYNMDNLYRATFDANRFVVETANSRSWGFPLIPLSRR